jgi:hypothetical protein
METFVASPYSLTQGDLIKVRIFSSNTLGDSVTSDVNTAGALTAVKPHTMPTGTRGQATSIS